MERKKLRQLNIGQLVIAFVIIVAVCALSSILFFRLDLTSEKRHTLTKTTKELIQHTDADINITIYIEGDNLPLGFKKLKNAAKELLDEMKAYSNSKIVYSFVNPSESDDKAVRFKMYTELQKMGIQPIELKEKTAKGSSSQSYIFPGAVIRYKDQAIAVNLLKNNQMLSADMNLNFSEQALEYEFTNALTKLKAKKIHQIAFIEGHGELSEAEVFDMERTLGEYYDIKRGAINGKSGSLDSFSVVIVAKPTKPFDERDKFVIDQYLMKGGKIVWMVDGAIIDNDSLSRSNTVVAVGNPLNLEDQLFKYGVRINQDLVEDYICAPIGVNTPTPNGQSSIQLFPWHYAPLIITENKHPINRFISIIKTNFVSSIDTVGNSSLIKKTALLTTTSQTKRVQLPSVVSLLDLNQSKKNDFTQAPATIAVLLEGQFESIYRNRPVSNLIRENIPPVEQSKSTAMIFISDGDMARNDLQANGEAYPLGFDKKTKKNYAGNKEFLLNCINYLCDDKGLMSLRLREIKMRVLDKKLISEEGTLVKTMNVLIPLLIVIALGLVYHWRRKSMFK